MILSVVVLCINLFFAGVYLSALHDQHWALYLLFAVLIVFYLSFVIYLVRISKLKVYHHDCLYITGRNES